MHLNCAIIPHVTLYDKINSVTRTFTPLEGQKFPTGRKINNTDLEYAH